MSITRHHNDWLRLVPNSGPFLSLPVLAQVFPQGLDAHDAEHARRLRTAFNEWDDNQLGQRPDPGLHRAWLKFVLSETLGYEALLAEGQEIPQSLKSDIAEYGETLRPDWIINDPATKKARLLVQVYPRSQSLTKPVATSRWKTSPDTRMMQLLHDTGIRLGIISNGDHWMLVNAPKNETTGYASWYANLWVEEPVTLRAFRTILASDRLFNVPEDQTLEALLDKSASDQQEVTDQLGYQVRRAVEVLIQALDKADQDHGRKLLADVNEKVLYESALTVMMRLVFLFCAEERELLLLGDELYDKNYAVSTLREQLRVTADQFGEEILGLRYDAWTRLLTTFRAVYAGAKHDRLKLPAYGGSLFNPDRFPFLEGRKPGTNWKTTEATPLPVSNRTVLHLLEALQVLQTKVGNTTEARNLSFRSLDIEQIGHVYEGLLDHTAKRATEPVLGLAGTRDMEPEIALAELEKISAKGEKELLKFLKDQTGRSESALKKGLNADLEDQLASRFRTACQDSELWKRVKKFAGLIRLDAVGYPVVITTNSVFVTAGTDRRSSGTHYTPKSLTEPIVQYTLEPLIYDGPSDGKPKSEWKLRTARELLDMKVCDIACGSGAFLVEACRYLAARLQEAWQELERERPGQVRLTPDGVPSQGAVNEELIPANPDEREAYARRLIAQRCIYGVDKNPLAVEIAKLSIWLLTLAKDRPFHFLDHAIKHGDSLVGLHRIEQLQQFSLTADSGTTGRLTVGRLNDDIEFAIRQRNRLEAIAATTLEDVDRQAALDHEASARLAYLKAAGDMLVGAETLPWDLHELIQNEIDHDPENETGPSWLRAKKENEAFRDAARTVAATKAAAMYLNDPIGLHEEAIAWLNGITPFHWPLEFPEVFITKGGFDACIGNPPFMGGQKITGFLGTLYREYLVHHLARGKRGSADLCAYFFLRAAQLVRPGAGFGLIASNTIAQGDTREVAFDLLLAANFIVNRAHSSRPWPGLASLEISVVWVRKGGWNGLYVLDEKPTQGITAYLTPPNTVTGNPYRLKANEGKSFQGSIVLGMGFVLTPEEAQALIAKDARNKDVLFPYLNGDDLNSRPDQSPSRWVINFFDWPIEKAKEYPDCFCIVEEKVKPERMALRDTADGKRLKQRWWLFCRNRSELYSAIADLDRVIVGVRHTKYHAMTFVAKGMVYSDATYVVTRDEFHWLALLQSSIHEVWAREYSGSLETRLRYSPTDCFETYPNPPRVDELVGSGAAFYEALHKIMISRREGLTEVLNRFHDRNEQSDETQVLRSLYVEIDRAVAAAYGWINLNLDHDFYKTKQGVRYTISEAARLEVLARLLNLNFERYAEEVEKELHNKKAKGSSPANRKPKSAASNRTPSTLPNLFDMSGEEVAFPNTDQERLLCGLLCDLVAVEPGLRFDAYLDGLVIALSPHKYNRLLIGDEKTKFTKLAEKLNGAVGQGDLSIPWDNLVRVLSQRKAIRKSAGTSFKKGSEFETVRPDFPDCDPKLVALVQKAAMTLREYQDLGTSAPALAKELVSQNVEDRRTLVEAAK